MTKLTSLIQLSLPFLPISLRLLSRDHVFDPVHCGEHLNGFPRILIVKESIFNAILIPLIE